METLHLMLFGNTNHHQHQQAPTSEMLRVTVGSIYVWRPNPSVCPSKKSNSYEVFHLDRALTSDLTAEKASSLHRSQSSASANTEWTFLSRFKQVNLKQNVRCPNIDFDLSVSISWVHKVADRPTRLSFRKCFATFNRYVSLTFIKLL